MSEWRATVDPCKSAREYVPGLLVGHAVPKHGAQWVWYFFDEHALRGEPDGEAPTEADAQDACDAAAVAWVLIALAKRAGQWAEGIDAELARRYRAAWEAREALAPAYRASLAKRAPPIDISVDEFTPEERAWFDADAAVRGALDDLRRGYP